MHSAAQHVQKGTACFGMQSKAQHAQPQHCLTCVASAKWCDVTPVRRFRASRKASQRAFSRPGTEARSLLAAALRRPLCMRRDREAARGCLDSGCLDGDCVASASSGSLERRSSTASFSQPPESGVSNAAGADSSQVRWWQEKCAATAAEQSGCARASAWGSSRKMRRRRVAAENRVDRICGWGEGARGERLSGS